MRPDISSLDRKYDRWRFVFLSLKPIGSSSKQILEISLISVMTFFLGKSSLMSQVVRMDLESDMENSGSLLQRTRIYWHCQMFEFFKCLILSASPLKKKMYGYFDIILLNLASKSSSKDSMHIGTSEYRRVSSIKYSIPNIEPPHTNK